MQTAEGADPRTAARRFRRLPPEFKSLIRKYQRAAFNPIWREEVTTAAASAARAA